MKDLKDGWQSARQCGSRMILGIGKHRELPAHRVLYCKRADLIKDPASMTFVQGGHDVADFAGARGIEEGLVQDAHNGDHLLGLERIDTIDYGPFDLSHCFPSMRFCILRNRYFCAA